MAYSYRLKLVQNNAILDRIDVHSNDWLQRPSGFAIELSVHHHLQHLSFQRFLYMKENDFSPYGTERFLMNIFFPEPILNGNGIQLTLPNPNGVSGSRWTHTVYSLEDMKFFVCNSVRLIRDDPNNFAMKFVPVQIDLEVLTNLNFQRLDYSIIWDAVDYDEPIYNPVGLSHVWWPQFYHLEDTVASLRALKDVKVEDSSSVDCSICLESVGAGQIASQTPCTHIFHANCILSWLQVKPSCPLCRAPVR